MVKGFRISLYIDTCVIGLCKNLTKIVHGVILLCYSWRNFIAG